MTQKINVQKEALAEREKKILLELESSEANIKAKAKTVGKIALVSGIVALVAYWGYNAFWADSDEEQPKKKKKKKKSGNQLSQIVTPYIATFLAGILDLDEAEKAEKPE